MKKSPAFTLLEVMLVLMLMLFAFFPLLQVLSGTLLASNEVRGTNTAGILAQKKLEELTNKPYIQISNESKDTVSGYPSYTRQVIVSESPANLKHVGVIVYWFPGEGSEMSVSMETYVANF